MGRNRSHRQDLDRARPTYEEPKQHIVPLSPQLFSLIEALPKINASSYLFPNSKATGHLSNMAFAQVLKRMGYSNTHVTVHGFRSSFRDWASEQTNFASDVAEKALSHTIRNKVEAAYRRGDLLEKRRRLMTVWANYCEQVRVDKRSRVVPINPPITPKATGGNKT